MEANRIARLERSALECADHDAAIAKRLLILFEKANEIHVADRDRLIKALRAEGLASALCGAHIGR